MLEKQEKHINMIHEEIYDRERHILEQGTKYAPCWKSKAMRATIHMKIEGERIQGRFYMGIFKFA